MDKNNRTENKKHAAAMIAEAQELQKEDTEDPNAYYKALDLAPEPFHLPEFIPIIEGHISNGLL